MFRDVVERQSVSNARTLRHLVRAIIAANTGLFSAAARFANGRLGAEPRGNNTFKGRWRVSGRRSP